MDPINNQNSSGMMNGMPPVPKQERKLGPIVGVIVVVLILIVAALFFFGKDLNTEAPLDQTPAPVDEQAFVPENTSAAAVNSADDLADIQTELEAEFEDVDYSF